MVFCYNNPNSHRGFINYVLQFKIKVTIGTCCLIVNSNSFRKSCYEIDAAKVNNFRYITICIIFFSL